jgi:arylsulfatase A-like enzyme
MKTSTRLAALALAAALAIFCGRSEVEPRSERLDVVLFVVDTLRADRLGCYGYDRATSPAFDALAAGGTRFERCWSQSSWTAPSMVSLLRSRFVAADFKKMPQEPVGASLVEHLRDHGYDTIGFQYNVLLGRESGFEVGFDRYYVEPSRDEILEHIEASRAPGDPPRFLYFHFVDPHDPYRPHPEFDQFKARALPPPLVAEYRAALAAARPELDEIALKKQLRREVEEIAEIHALYDGEVRAVDQKLKELLAILERAGRLERTIVILASDHGECLYEHREVPLLVPAEKRGNLRGIYKETHNSLLTENLLHVPLIFSGPGVPRGAVFHPLVGNVDLAPTLLSLLSLPPLPGGDAIDGIDLVPQLRALERGEVPRGRDVAFANTSVFTAARTASGAKLVLSYDETATSAFFDLTRDPAERHPVAIEDGGEAAKGLDQAIRGIRATGLRASSNEEQIDPLTRARMEQLGYLGPGGR